MLRMMGLTVLGMAALGQDPYVTLPRNYKLELENEFVRISHVRNDPGDKLPMHSHPTLPTVYVYLTDAGPIRFDHMGLIIERPAVKAGGVRFNRNVQMETHDAKYLGDAAAEYLRIELKTTPGAPHRDARLRTDADFPWEDEQVRISRMQRAPEKLTSRAVIVTDRGFKWVDPGTGGVGPAMEPGTTWVVVVELKTGPAENTRTPKQ